MQCVQSYIEYSNSGTKTDRSVELDRVENSYV